MIQFSEFLKCLFTGLLCCLASLSFAQTVKKGLPADLDKTELVIVRFEPKDLIPSEAKSHSDIYIQDNDLNKATAEANIALTEALKFTFTYRIVSREQLKKLSGQDFYIFEPSEIYGTGGPWGTVPLYIRHSTTKDIYEIGFMPKNGIFSAGKVMSSFLECLPKTIPVQALESVEEK
ncbi:hypothetical protein [Adhaeribacter soli]|uniref:Lipoprotein n=1 Tax=Adhaeribacter soli TaxID=2607655 RepID=A0A5N1IQB4_9BACT|nr:hypothetical protein [Adhaeribacter soli]KAA9331948.1 hypothetical protein F0P94_14220 [Adhaeribacter soli]